MELTEEEKQLVLKRRELLAANAKENVELETYDTSQIKNGMSREERHKAARAIHRAMTAPKPQ